MKASHVLVALREDSVGRKLSMTILLAALLLIHNWVPTAFVIRIILVVLVVATWTVSSQSRRARIMLAVISTPIITAVLLDIFAPALRDLMFGGSLPTLLLILSVVLLLYCATLLMMKLIQTRRATGGEILDAISLYFVLGFVWASCTRLLNSSYRVRSVWGPARMWVFRQASTPHG